MHSANELMATSSLRTVHLRLKPSEKAALQQITEPLGALLLDEFSQMQGQLAHADALRKTYGRQRAYNLDVAKYAEPQQTFGCIPHVAFFGDEIQLPPVPFEHSLLAPIEGTSDEHKVGVSIFPGMTYVYRLTRAMRFADPMLLRILDKMRTEGGVKLTATDWQALMNTAVTETNTGVLDGCEDFYQSCYTWSVVDMAYAIRSMESAKAKKATLF
ncbi:unnamed protein product [Polarella glacialis]|uniref:Uncharacterized protein n=1 Tax=Polarella glacialis TaxID=89957 RepID=A0A813L2S1_POLGL|nr:unnamed protein product [Polarella glacialis]